MLRLRTWNKSVLWDSIDKGNIFHDTSESIQGGRGNLRLIPVQRSKEIFHGVIQSHNHIAVP